MADIGGDIFSHRDVVERIDELEAEITTIEDEAIEKLIAGSEVGEPDARTAAEQELANQRGSEDDPVDSELREELKALKELEEQINADADLIRDSYFKTYAEQLAEDIGAIGKDAQWPLSYIDWDAAAQALRMDYSSVEYNGETYWYR